MDLLSQPSIRARAPRQEDEESDKASPLPATFDESLGCNMKRGQSNQESEAFRLHVYIHTYIHACMYIYIYVHVCIYIHIDIGMYICVYIDIHITMFVCRYIHVYS